MLLINKVPEKFGFGLLEQELVWSFLIGYCDFWHVNCYKNINFNTRLYFLPQLTVLFVTDECWEINEDGRFGPDRGEGYNEKVRSWYYAAVVSICCLLNFFSVCVSNKCVFVGLQKEEGGSQDDHNRWQEASKYLKENRSECHTCDWGS